MLGEPGNSRVQDLSERKEDTGVNHVGAHAGGQECGPEGGGIDVVEAGFDV